MTQPGERTRGRSRVVVAAGVVGALLLAGLLVWRTDLLGQNGSGAPCLAVGAAVNDGGRADLTMFRRAETILGRLTIRRSFDPSLPQSFADSAAGGDAAAGLASIVSWKPPNGDHRGAAAGRYDDLITHWARSVPRTGVYATAFHEPENDMSAPEFVAFERHVYRVVKAANPTIRWGPVYMAYWWDPGQPQHYVGDPAAWWPGRDYADFVGLDWYGTQPSPMTTSASFATWYRQMAPTGLPLLIPEYGQYFRPFSTAADPVEERARAAAIRQDTTWLLRHPRFRAWLYWQGGDARGEWRIRDRASQQAWQAAAAAGCRE